VIRWLILKLQLNRRRPIKKAEDSVVEDVVEEEDEVVVEVEEDEVVDVEEEERMKKEELGSLLPSLVVLSLTN